MKCRATRLSFRTRICRLADERRPATPSWFAVDKVFESSGGWYIGSQNGFSMGPYESEGVAKAQSLEVKTHLLRARNIGETLRIVRGFLERQDVGFRRRAEMSPVRAGERPKLRYRGERHFALDGRWYFMTREGIDVGPYESKPFAERDASRLVELLKHCETEEQAHLTIYEFMVRPATSPGGGGRRRILRGFGFLILIVALFSS